MLAPSRASRPRRRILLKDVNPAILCTQCTGYMIDATALVECLHTFCRACILKHFEASGKICPTCNLDYRKRNASVLRRDIQLQTLIYKMVSGLHSKEKQRREEFYSSTGMRASSSCSDDSLLEDIPDHEPFLSSTDSLDLFNPDDSISLSMEYYQNHLDTSSASKDIKKTDSANFNTNSSSQSKDLIDNSDNNNTSVSDQSGQTNKQADIRYLQCPAAVEMTHLQKFIRMKYGLSSEHKVDIIYQGEVLPFDLTLMDVAYAFHWNKIKPLRFFYRIFTLKKVQPIKIINTTSALGAKQLQIVSIEPPPQKPSPKTTIVSPTIKPIPKPVSDPIVSPKKDDISKKKQPEPIQVIHTTPPPKSKSPELQSNDNSRSNTCKERLMAQLQLQPNRDVNGKRLVEPRKTPERSPEGCYLREYPEPDKEEIKRFAEKRDREWKMLAEKDETIIPPHVNKKRKKSKHSKSDVTHKKRKLHAEITPSDEKQESIKLKLKVTQVNGHKHKHRSSSTSTVEETTAPSPQPANIQAKSVSNASDTSKQELLKLRGVRHKNISHADDKSVGSPKPPSAEEDKKVVTKVQPAKSEQVSTKLRSDFSYNSKASKETSEELKKQTFLKTFQSNAKDHKPAAAKVPSTAENERVKNNVVNNKTIPPGSFVGINNNLQNLINNQKNIEQQRSLPMSKQDSNVETKRNNSVNKPDRKVSFGSDHSKLKAQSEKPKIVSSQFTTNPGFTVSKIDNSPHGVKRKFEKPAQITDHRPSLEITVIPQPIYTRNPNAQILHQATRRASPAPAVKRPPPDTIPLERIIKSNAAAMNNKAGVSITPTTKPSSETTSGLVLDLSQKLANGLKQVTDNKGLSNLQMLSKVATEQVVSTKPLPKLTKAQIPNLQSITSFNKPLPNLTKMPPPGFRNTSNNNGSLIRTMVRPQIQNQSIRNIPNPSLLVRQQNQNRLNLATGDKVVNNGFKEQLHGKSVVVIEGKERVDSLTAAVGGGKS